MILYDSRRRAIQLGESVGRGGEATVYRVLNQNGSLAKIYEPQPRPNYPLKLAWMVENPPENPTQNHNHASLAWPSGLLYDGKRRLAGYTMPYIDQAVPLLEVFNPRRRAEVLPQFDRRYLHRTARNLAAAFSALHRSGYVAGDVNESNVLVTPTALVTLIDTDSFQVREERRGASVIYPCPVGKPEYTPPELQGKSLAEVTRLPDHDSFGLAVLIFQLLMEGSHPFRAQWLGQGDPLPMEARIAQGIFPYAALTANQVAPPKNAPSFDTLHPWLCELFRRCFVDGHRSPRWRPGPELWARALKQAEDSLICCAEGHYYSGHQSRCPYCARMRPQPVRPAASTEDDRPAAVWPKRAAQPPPRPAQKPPQPGFGSSLGGFARAAAAAAGPAAGSAAAAPAAAASPTWGSWRGLGPTGVLRHPKIMRPGAAGQWMRQRLYKSVTVGALQGALVGALPASALALLNWWTSGPLNWSLLLILSGVSAGMVRGYKPGYRLGILVDRYLGWKHFWRGVCAVMGTMLGGMFGLLFGWAVIPVILGVVLGARAGYYIGSQIWQLGNRVSWENIWGTVSALAAAGMGWGIATLAGSAGLNILGADLAVTLMPFSGNGEAYWALIWFAAGGSSGALIGALSGFIIDLLGRITALVN
jgi:serine/threonine protein kinase